ncbi:hypothetical protein [Gemmiger sp. An194]|uniref:hypothetical protein n=1 Tax=Gemmiger sp. An194 TaxID=1965582 RepID=UPI000B36A03B|nr:hypothetical protein [Gemmiger sp. An194]OUP24422.1 hypothetical protein B5F28_07250 [Gemmiger sp. An194]
MTDWPTMTLHDCCEALRANQIASSEDILGQMILEEKLPFAVGTRMDGSSRATFLIFRPAFYRWLDGMLDTDAIRI